MISKILSELNHHSADSFVFRDDVTHTYTIKLPEDANDAKLPELVSVSRLIERYFKPFDAVRISRLVSTTCHHISGHRYEGMSANDLQKQWADESEHARTKGHQLHRAIELFFNPDIEIGEEEFKTMENTKQSKEYCQFKQFWEDIQRSRSLEGDTIVPYRTEWIIYDRSARVAGTVDMLFKNVCDGTYTLVDWKRVKRLDRSGREKGNGILSKYYDCNMTKYMFQLNVYRYILENVYGLKIRNVFLVAMHPTRDAYHIEPIPKEPFTSETVQRIFQSLRTAHVLRWRLSQDMKENNLHLDCRAKRDSED
jgi:hypothetical protein